MSALFVKHADLVLREARGDDALSAPCQSKPHSS